MDGYDIRTVQELLGQRDVSTTMIYAHVLNRGGSGGHSFVDQLDRAVFVEAGFLLLSAGKDYSITHDHEIVGLGKIDRLT